MFPTYQKLDFFLETKPFLFPKFGNKMRFLSVMDDKTTKTKKNPTLKAGFFNILNSYKNGYYLIS